MKTYPTKGKHAKGVRWYKRVLPRTRGTRLMVRYPTPGDGARLSLVLGPRGKRRRARWTLPVPPEPRLALVHVMIGDSLIGGWPQDSAREWANTKGWGDQ